MKYQQPYGVSDPEAPYINGNPSTGTMGSIPPAASIEHPQREIVNAIALAKNGTGAQFAAPSASDLAQLADVIQSGLFNYARDAGTASNYQVTLSPVPNAYYENLTIVMRVGNENTGNSVINVNAMGAKPIVHSDGSQLPRGAMGAGQIVCLVYDLIGDRFVLVWSNRVAGQPIFLTAPKEFWVNYTTGLDTYDGVSATVTGGHGPFKTLQGAANAINKYNLNGYDITVWVADSLLYPSFFAPFPGGNGTVYWNGNWANYNSVQINGVNTNAISVMGGRHVFRGFRLTTSGSGNSALCNLWMMLGSSYVTLTDMDFGQCVGSHIALSRQCYMDITGYVRISGSSLGHPYMAAAFINCYYGATVDVNFGAPPALIWTAAWAFGTFIKASLAGSVGILFSSQTGAGDNGSKKYEAEMNGVIHTAGQGVNYLPGGVPGTTSTGGQYV